MGHFDQHNDFFADPNFAKNPVDRQKLSLIMNKSTEELTSFLESHPAFRTNTKKALPDTVNQSSSVSSSMDCYGHHVQGRAKRCTNSKPATKSKNSSASRTRLVKKNLLLK